MSRSSSPTPTLISAVWPTVLIFGATRGVGYHAYHRLLCNAIRGGCREDGLHFVLLVRSKARFLASKEYANLPEEPYSITDIIEGDVTNIDDVRACVEAAGDGLQTVVFTLGK